ncbi:MAG TPA: glycosyltransferase family 39 protein [Terriglobales bacterium]|nr:glycosyltransferase family 39 protein [Terriglobales bacterium]
MDAQSTIAAPQGAVLRPPTNIRRKLLWIFVISLVLRLAILMPRAWHFHYQPDESTNISAALASGEGFANPFGLKTGPTAWLPPLYQWLMAGVFELFGIKTRASAAVILALNCLFDSLTIIPLFFAAYRTFGQKIALWSAWTWAFFPYAIYWAIHTNWDTCLSTMVFTFIFWMTLELAEGRGLNAWIAWGLLWGISALSNTATLAFLPLAAGWILWRNRHSFMRTLLNGAVAAILFAAVITPWLVRNYVTFGKFIPIRGNFGLELYIGNSPGANGMWQFWLHPSQNVLEMNRYIELGEPAYVAEKAREAKALIHQDPMRFAKLSVIRFVYYWAGVPRPEKYNIISDLRQSLFLGFSVLAIWGAIRAWRHRIRGAGLYVLLLLSFPTVYYFVFPNARYRHPIDTELAILAIYLIADALHKFTPERSPEFASAE